MASVLVVDDEPAIRLTVTRALDRVGHQVSEAESVAEATATVRESPPDLVLLDLRLPDGSGLEVLSNIQGFDPELPVILITAFGSVPEAVEAIRRGAVDYLQKPVDVDELRLLVARALDARRKENELRYLRDRTRPDGVLAEDPPLLKILEQVGRVASAELPPEDRPPVLLTGETGTGKGVLARAIHESLGGGPFVELNCTAVPESLVEAELFGHERGTFTDAKVARGGLFEAADGGALFLDEIGHASTELQAKLLKVLEDRRIRRLGSTRDRPVQVHVLAATNRDLDEAVDCGEFRRDLLHRLRVLDFRIPPLRERDRDLRLLAEHFARELGQRYQRDVALLDDAFRELARYPWPGNARELRNVLERAVILSTDGRIGGRIIAEQLRPPSQDPAGDDLFTLPEGGVRLAELERQLIEQAIERTRGNKAQAANLLGLSRHALRYRLEKSER